ncbi:MAG: adenylate kinase [Actinomycetota bacterium]
MRLVLVGPPGAGKGTQAALLAGHYKIPHISTGDIFRVNLKEGTELGLQAKSYMDKGELVPDSVTNAMVKDRLTHGDTENGFLLDGFPRNVAQAEVLRACLGERTRPLDAVVEFSIDNNEIIKRLSSRRTCKGCGTIFAAHLDKCDACGGELYQRDDDKEDVIARRLEVYVEQTAPIVSFYRGEGLLITISALGDVSAITDNVIRALNSKVN